MKLTQTILALSLGLALNSVSFGAVNTTTTNGITIQTALIAAEPALGPFHATFTLGTMAWLNAPNHPYVKGWLRGTPADVVPWNDMWRPWDVIFSSNPSYHTWAGQSDPTNQYSNAYGTMLQGPLMIGTGTNQTFDPRSVWYSWHSSDGPNNAFGGIHGQLAYLNGTTNLQSWSTTCAGYIVTNGVTNTFTSGVMTNRVNWITYSGVTGGFAVTNTAGLMYASNYCAYYWPFDISVTYTVKDDANVNVLCQSTATLGSTWKFHYGSVTNTAPNMPVFATFEMWDNMHYQINTFTNQLSGKVPYVLIGDGGVIPNTNTAQNFEFPDPAAKPLGYPQNNVVAHTVTKQTGLTAPPVVFNQ